MNKLEAEILEKVIEKLNNIIGNYLMQVELIQESASKFYNWKEIKYDNERTLANFIYDKIDAKILEEKLNDEVNIIKIPEFSLKNEISSKDREKIINEIIDDQKKSVTSALKKKFKMDKLVLDDLWNNSMIPDVYLMVSRSNPNDNFDVFIEFKKGNKIKYSDIAIDFLKYKFYTNNSDRTSYFIYVDFLINAESEKKVSINYKSNEQNFVELGKEMSIKDVDFDKHIYVHQNTKNSSSSITKKKMETIIKNYSIFKINYSFIDDEEKETKEEIYKNIRNLNKSGLFEYKELFGSNVVLSRNVVSAFPKIEKMFSEIVSRMNQPNFYFTWKDRIERNLINYRNSESNWNSEIKAKQKWIQENENNDSINETKKNNKEELTKLKNELLSSRLYEEFSEKLFIEEFKDKESEYDFTNSLTNMVQKLIKYVEGKIGKRNNMFSKISRRRGVFLLLLIENSYSTFRRLEKNSTDPNYDDLLLIDVLNENKEKIFDKTEYDELREIIKGSTLEMATDFYLAGISLIIYMYRLFTFILGKNYNLKNDDKQIYRDIYRIVFTYEAKNKIIENYSSIVKPKKKDKHKKKDVFYNEEFKDVQEGAERDRHWEYDVEQLSQEIMTYILEELD